MIIGIIICILIVVFIIAVYKTSLKDYEGEESKKRQEYYDNIREQYEKKKRNKQA